VNELVDAIALRLRHNAAMDTVETVSEDERYELLWDVLLPSKRLLEASTGAALEDLRRRHHHDAVAA
jgi:hypothetical protein